MVCTVETGWKKNSRRRKPDIETWTALEENTKEELMKKIVVLKEAYDDIKGDRKIQIF